MPTSDFPTENLTPIEPLIGRASPFEAAADTMLAASRTMLAAASALSSAFAPSGARTTELLTQAIELGFLRALRRDALLGPEASTEASSLLGLPKAKEFPGTGYGRMGAAITGKGARAQLYGSIGGAIGYAVAGPIGAVIGGMLGGLLGGDGDDEAERARQQEQLRRQWLNTPEGFQIQAYLYNLTMRHTTTRTLVPFGTALAHSSLPFLSLAFPGRWGAQQTQSGQFGWPALIINFPPGAIQITGQGEEAGERAARAFAGALGRVLRLNSVVVPAAGLGGDL